MTTASLLWASGGASYTRWTPRLARFSGGGPTRAARSGTIAYPTAWCTSRKAEKLHQILTKDVNGYTVRSPVYGTEVFALDARSGNEIWQYRPEPDRWPGRSFSSEGALVVQSEPYFALDAETGRLLWEAHVTGVTNYASDGVIYEDGPWVTALDMTTGKALWRQMHSSVEVLGAADDIVLVRRPLDHLHGLDAKTGRTLWTHHQNGPKFVAQE